MALARFIADRLRRLLSRTSGSERAEAARIGHFGEREAARYLRRHGFKILYRNFRPRRGGEIDLVCRDSDTLVFVEIKTRTSEHFGRPLEGLTLRQRRRIQQGAVEWLRMLDRREISVRFDLIEVVGLKDPEVRHFQGAIPLPDSWLL